MSPIVRKRPAAQRDLLEHFVTLGERAGEATALDLLIYFVPCEHRRYRTH